MASQVLFVDDDPNILAGFQRSLRKQFDVFIALSGSIALKLIAEQGPFAVIVSDMNMPEMNGVQFLSRANEVAPDSIKIMLTGNADLRVAVQALHEGRIFQFLVKPCEPQSLELAIRSAEWQYQLVVAERELLDKTLRGSIRVMIEILSAVQPSLFGKAQTVRRHMRRLAKALGIEETWTLDLATMLAPIGAVTLPANILEKCKRKAPLSQVEQNMLGRIPEISHNLIVNIPRLEPVAKMILYSKHDYTTSSSPNHLAPDHVPRGARMLRVVSDFTDLTDAGDNRATAIRTMERKRGAYDPVILETLASLEGEFQFAGLHGLAISSIGVRDLRPSMVLMKDVEACDGTLLISKGHQMTETLIAKVRNYMEFAGVREPIDVISIGVHEQRAA